MTTADETTPTQQVASAPEAAGDPGRWWTLTAVSLGTFMLLLDITIVNVALPAIQTDLKSSFSGLQWVVDAYALTLAATLLTSGSLADLFGRRLLYVIGMIAFTLASLLCGIAPNTLFLQIARGAQGVGGAIMFSVSLALLADAFRGKERGVAFGVWGTVTGLAVAVGPVLGGVLTSGLSWRWIFFVNLPIGALALALTVMRVRESRDPRSRRPDWIGFVMFTASLTFLVFGLIKSSELHFSDPLVLWCFAASAALMAGFLVLEVVVEHPMFDLTLFRKPTFSGGAIAAFGVSATIFSMFLYLTLYLQDVLDYSPLQTGVRLLVASGGIFVVAGVSGRLSAFVPIRLLIGPGLLLVGAGLLLMRGLDVNSTWTHLVLGLIVAGMGVGLLNPPLASTAVGVAPPHQAGMASGINSTFRQVGIATGIALLGSLFASRVHDAATTNLAHVPGLGSGAARVAQALTNGQLASTIKSLPAAQRGPVGAASRSAFTTGLNHILLVSAIMAFACGVLTLLLIRTQDFVHVAHGESAPAAAH